VLSTLSTHARNDLEAFMSIAADRYESDFARRYFLEGEIAGERRGEIRAVLAVLESRGLDVSSAARERISACSDLDELERWILRAMTVNTVDALFQD
jgi:hypothetical protein